MSAGQARSAEEKHRDCQELEALRQKEHAAKRSRTLQRGTRYNPAHIKSPHSLTKTHFFYIFYLVLRNVIEPLHVIFRKLLFTSQYLYGLFEA